MNKDRGSRIEEWEEALMAGGVYLPVAVGSDPDADTILLSRRVHGHCPENGGGHVLYLPEGRAFCYACGQAIRAGESGEWKG